MGGRSPPKHPRLLTALPLRQRRRQRLQRRGRSAPLQHGGSPNALRNRLGLQGNFSVADPKHSLLNEYAEESKITASFLIQSVVMMDNLADVPQMIMSIMTTDCIRKEAGSQRG
jgi:hypothetical protein